MRRIWQRMAEVYGHRWTSAYGDDAGTGAGVTWAKGLAGVSLEQIADGINAALVSADGWPPTLPEFRAQCLGIPTLAAAKLALNDSSNRFALLMWQRMDRYLHRQATQERADAMTAGAYDLAREHVMRGGALPEIPAGEVEHKTEPRKPADPEKAAVYIAELEALLGDTND